MEIIEPRSGAGIQLMVGDRLTITDLKGEQVADLYCASSLDPTEQFSSGRTMDYNESTRVGAGSLLYSSKSLPMLKVVSDSVECHDILLTPCSADTFAIMYDDLEPHRGCQGNLEAALKDMGVEVQSFPATFNIFMKVTVDQDTGKLSVETPTSRAGDSLTVEALMDVKVGLTACSAPNSNGGHCTAIGYEIVRASPKEGVCP